MAYSKNRIFSLPPKTPLLLIAVALMCGVLLFYNFQAPISWILVLGAGIVIFLVNYILVKRKVSFQKYFLKGSILIFLISGMYYYTQYYSSVQDNDRNLPPREVLIEIKLKRFFQSRNIESKDNSFRGVAIVESAPIHLKYLIGQRVFFNLKNKIENSIPHVGEVIKIKAVLRKNNFYENGQDQSNDNNPPDYWIRFLKSQNLNYSLMRGELIAVTKKPSVYFQFLSNQLQNIQSTLTMNLDDEALSTKVYLAMMLGQYSSLSADEKSLFTFSGTVHLFAISGLHIGIIGAVIFCLLRPLNLHLFVNIPIGLILLFLFVQITGSPPSAIRAFIMMAIYLFSHLINYKSSIWANLLLSFVISLFINPFDLLNIGFQLSYVVVASIVLLALPFSKLILRRFNICNPYTIIFQPPVTILREKFLKFCIVSVCINIAATIMSTPLTVHYFQICTPGAIFINFCLVPMASIILCLGVLSIACGYLSILFPVLMGIVSFFNIIAARLIELMLLLLDSVKNIPYLAFQTSPSTSNIFYYILFSLMLVSYFYRYFINKLFNLIRKKRGEGEIMNT